MQFSRVIAILQFSQLQFLQFSQALAKKVSVLMIFGKILEHLSRNSKTKCEKMFYFSFHNRERLQFCQLRKNKRVRNWIAKKSNISKFHFGENLTFQQASREKNANFTDFRQRKKKSCNYIANRKYLYIFKKINRKKTPFCRYSVKYFRIYHVIQKSNVRKCYILAALIVKRLEFRDFG